jgi:meso-butanediol dehydrogenase / (S,S)-butanediol dehydrogenase / diacetyl reductase
MIDLRGRVAIVTGGGRGIGAAIAAKLAAQGAQVAISDIDIGVAETTLGAIRATGGKALAFQHNVTSWDSSFGLVEAVEKAFGPIEILVNNAGVSGRTPITEVTEAEWDRILDINLKGQFLTTRAVIPGMINRRRGRIVNMASVVSKQGFPAFSAYCTSKFGVLGFTQCIAKEMAEYGITVNAVCPGIVMTPLHDQVVQQMADAALVSFDKAKENFIGNIPLGHAQEPDDVANMVAYLVSDLARNMTGGSYHVDGGMMMD